MESATPRFGLPSRARGNARIRTDRVEPGRQALRNRGGRRAVHDLRSAPVRLATAEGAAHLHRPRRPGDCPPLQPGRHLPRLRSAEHQRPLVGFDQGAGRAASIAACRSRATCRANGLPGPPALPLANRPCASPPLSPFADGPAQILPATLTLPAAPLPGFVDGWVYWPILGKAHCVIHGRLLRSRSLKGGRRADAAHDLGETNMPAASPRQRAPSSMKCTIVH